jgi:uncharacterized membrane protein YhhN
VTAPLAALLLACGAATIVADYAGRRPVVYACKPLTILVAMAIAATAAGGPPPPYRALILAGLACSLVGDVFLMLPEKRFAAGAAPAPAGTLLLAAAAAVGVAVAVPLWPHLGRFRVPVVIYVVALVALLWQAGGWAASAGTVNARFAAAGAMLFTASDAVLAHNRFRRPFRAAQAVILSTYFVAQGLIATSVGTSLR